MALSPAQLAALRQGHAQGKICVEIDATSPLRYCTCQNPVQVGSDWYYPRWMRGSQFDLTSPGASRTVIEIDDRDKVIETAWYLDRFSGDDVSVHILLRTPPDESWTTASSFVWKCEKGACKGGVVFVLSLFAAMGSKQRYGLTVGNSSIFPWAPQPGTQFTFGGNTTVASPPSTTNPYAELYGTPSGTYWSLIDPTGIMAYEAGLDRPYWVSEANWAALGGENVVVMA